MKLLLETKGSKVNILETKGSKEEKDQDAIHQQRRYEDWMLGRSGK